MPTESNTFKKKVTSSADQLRISERPRRPCKQEASRGLGGVSMQCPSICPSGTLPCLMHEMTATPHQCCRGQLVYSVTPKKQRDLRSPNTGERKWEPGAKRYFVQGCIRKCGPSATAFTTFKEDCHPGKLHSPPQQETEDFALEKLNGAEKRSLHKNVYFIHFNCYPKGIFSKHL